jgi:integrase
MNMVITRNNQNDSLFDSKIESIIRGLRPDCKTHLQKISMENALIIIDYITSVETEINLSNSYRRDLIIVLCRLSHSTNHKPFEQITRQDVVTFLDSFRKPEEVDPLHKWVGTYNLFGIHLIRFFKWLYYHDIEQAKRPKPSVVENIPQLKRKEQSIYKPTDLWTQEDDLLFLKYCPSKRIKCYHTMSRDTGCRPHELLKLRIHDVVFKSTGDKQYAEVLVNGKTGSRHIPLINSLPYLKDYMDQEHPQANNSQAPLFAGKGKCFGSSIQQHSLYLMYDNYTKELFPRLLQNSKSIPPEDKPKIRALLKKPWNPYIRRHSALTEKSVFLKEHILRQHAEWSPRFQMHLRYLHYFGNESSESILEAYGIITKDKSQSNTLRSKQCPNCNEPNKPDSKFCAKCRMVLTYDAYNETIEEKQVKDKQIEEMVRKQEKFEQLIQSLIDSGQLTPNTK